MDWGGGSLRLGDIASVCMNVYRTKFLEEEWRVKLAEDTNWLTTKYKNGHMKVLRGDR